MSAASRSANSITSLASSDSSEACAAESPDASPLDGIQEPLYLAVPLFAYQHFVEQVAIHRTLEDAKISLIVIDLEMEEVAQWIR